MLRFKRAKKKRTYISNIYLSVDTSNSLLRWEMETSISTSRNDGKTMSVTLIPGGPSEIDYAFRCDKMLSICVAKIWWFAGDHKEQLKNYFGSAVIRSLDNFPDIRLLKRSGVYCNYSQNCMIYFTIHKASYTNRNISLRACLCIVKFIIRQNKLYENVFIRALCLGVVSSK